MQSLSPLLGPLVNAIGKIMGNAVAGTAAKAPGGSAGATGSNTYPLANLFQNAGQEQMFAMLSLGILALMCFGSKSK
jgi:hypothetical protein